MKYTKRQIELLEMARDAFMDVRSPFSTESLVENNVTASECFWLSKEIAEIVDIYIPARRGES